MSEEVNEKRKEKIRQYRLGKHHSEETKMKISLAQKGHSKNTKCYNNGYINVWIVDGGFIPKGFVRGYIFESNVEVENEVENTEKV